VSCSKVRRELLEQFRFNEELGSRSGPHLAHLESCAACREEVGIDRQLVEQLRRALRERVEGSAPSAASWDLVRIRTVDRPVMPWKTRVLQWGSLLPAAVAGLMMFAVATASETGLLNLTQSPSPVTISAQHTVPVGRATAWEPPSWATKRPPQAVPELPSGQAEIQPVSENPNSIGEMPPISRRMQ
jgi:hypothetical protein